jgi:myo-inositol-1(or 4)-monophosphatase
MKALRTETEAAVEAVREALELAKQGTGDVHAKVGRDVVTDADLTVEDLLRDSLSRVCIWPVIGEERGGQQPEGSPYWLVDPICGTRNFASRIPLFAVNVALVEDGGVTLSVVGDGSTGDVLCAEAQAGAWRVSADRREPLVVGAESLVMDFGAWPKPAAERSAAARHLALAVELDRWDVRCFSTTLSLAYVATGQIAGCLLFATPDLVHVAAGSLLVAEAGGRVTDVAGEPWGLSSTSLVCTASEELHQEILEVLRADG